MIRSLRAARHSRGVAITCLVLALGGCALSRPAPVKETFLLDPPQPARSAAVHAHPGTLRVGTVTVAGAFRDRTFVLRQDDVRYVTDYYHEYVTPPAPMLAELVSQALASGRVFTRTTAPGTAADADYVLDAFVNAFYADRRNSNATRAEMAITFYLTQSDSGNNVPFWTHHYSESVAYTGDGADAYVRAQNVALGKILVALVSDLAALKVTPPAP